MCFSIFFHPYFSIYKKGIMSFSHCAYSSYRWVRPDLGEQTGMSVMEVDMPTGYVIMNDVLRRYVQSGVVPALRRAEYYARRVTFYFDYVRI